MLSVYFGAVQFVTFVFFMYILFVRQATLSLMWIIVMSIPIAILSAITIFLTGVPVSTTICTVMTTKFAARKFHLSFLCFLHICTTFPYLIICISSCRMITSFSLLLAKKEITRLSLGIIIGKYNSSTHSGMLLKTCFMYSISPDDKVFCPSTVSYTHLTLPTILRV